MQTEFDVMRDALVRQAGASHAAIVTGRGQPPGAARTIKLFGWSDWLRAGYDTLEFAFDEAGQFIGVYVD